jgi:hypothetical protein
LQGKGGHSSAKDLGPDEGAATNAGASEGGPPGMTRYKGLTRKNGRGKFELKVQLGGKTRFLGRFSPQEVEEAARLVDCVQLLVYGPNADTNFQWSNYSTANIEAAAQTLQEMGVDVQQAVVDAGGSRHSKGGRLRLGVTQLPDRSIFGAQVSYREAFGKRQIHLGSGLRSEEAAARQADLGLLAIQGLGCRRTNNQASTYTHRELEEAGEYAVEKKVPKEVVATNLEEVKQVRDKLHSRHVFSCTGVASARGQEVCPV